MECFYAVYVAGIVIVGIVLLASEMENEPLLDQGGLLVCAVFAALWPLFLIGILYDSYRARRARLRDHDPDAY